MPRSTSGRKQREFAGRLRIGDDWNAIHIIALSQSNPLKAVAEFVENAIGARATSITIVRGRERGETASVLRCDCATWRLPASKTPIISWFFKEFNGWNEIDQAQRAGSK